VQKQKLENEKLETEIKSLKEDLQETQVRFFEVTTVIYRLVSPNKSFGFFFKKSFFLKIIINGVQVNTGFLKFMYQYHLRLALKKRS